MLLRLGGSAGAPLLVTLFRCQLTPPRSIVRLLRPVLKRVKREMCKIRADRTQIVDNTRDPEHILQA